MRGLYFQYAGIALVLVAGCIVDPDKPCGDKQEQTTGEFQGCVCAAGHAWSSDGKRCVACGRNEVVREGACVCEEGFERANSGAACEAVEDASTEDTGTDEAPPTGSTGEGTPCTTSVDCEGLYATYCVTLQAPNVCLVQGCATGERTCSAPNVCCSFETLPPLASTNGLCLPAANCIGPGKQVDP